jgi:hypothetical protein
MPVSTAWSWSSWRYSSIAGQFLGVADVVPHGRAVRPRRHGVDVVAQELGRSKGVIRFG